jgi:IPT/TIG domain
MNESQKPNNNTINKENKTSEHALDPLTNEIKFDVDNLDPSIKKSPVALKKWLDYRIPWLIGPRIDSFCPSGGHRGSIITIRGNNFASNRLDNNVTIGAISLPVLKANTTELKVLVTKDVDIGPIKVSIGTLSAQSTQNFIIKMYPNGIIDDDGPPLFAIGEGDGQMGDVNPIGTVQVLVVICQALDKVPSNLAAVRTTVNNRWTDAQTFYTQASYSRTNVQYDIVSTAAQLDGISQILLIYLQLFKILYPDKEIALLLLRLSMLKMKVVTLTTIICYAVLYLQIVHLLGPGAELTHRIFRTMTVR